MFEEKQSGSRRLATLIAIMWTLCLEWGVILNGPGVYGSWPACEDRIRKDGYAERKITDLRRFCEGMQDGDLVVLRLGTSFVYGVGQIVDRYEWCDNFNDVDGWDLGHVRRVRWLWKYNEQHNGKPRKFDTHTLRWGDTTQLPECSRCGIVAGVGENI